MTASKLKDSSADRSIKTQYKMASNVNGDTVEGLTSVYYYYSVVIAYPQHLWKTPSFILIQIIQLYFSFPTFYFIFIKGQGPSFHKPLTDWTPILFYMYCT